MRVFRRVDAILVAVTVVAASAAFALIGPAAAAQAAGTHVAYGFGDNSFDQLGNYPGGGSASTPIPVQGLAPDVTRLSAGVDSVAALHADGSVWTWGAAHLLGDGTTTMRSAPGKVPGLPAIAQISVGQDHVLAVGTDGSLWGWGQGIYGQLGTGADPPVDSATPVRVNISGVVQASAGYQFSMALLSDGSVWTWGLNSNGQLGAGTDAAESIVPIRSLAPAGITQVAAGSSFALALAGDGSVWGWGYNEYGEIGQLTGTLANSTPVRVGGAAGFGGVTQIAAGDQTSVALRSDGTLWTWGSNLYGQLGTGANDADPHANPIPVTLPSGFTGTAIAASTGIVTVILSNGSLAALGKFRGELNFSPVVITYPTDVTLVAAGGFAILFTMTPQPVTVPQFLYLSYTDPPSTALISYLKIGRMTMVESPCQSAGTVVAQSLAAGSSTLPETAIDITYVDPNVSCSATVPTIVGFNRANAQAALTNAGFQLGNETDVAQPACGDTINTVLSQSPAAGTVTNLGTAVSIRYGIRPTGNSHCN